MNLYFQVLTQVQSKSALEVLQFPGVFNQAQHIEGTGKMSAGGIISSFKFKCGEDLVAKATKRKFNELEIRYSSESFDGDLLGDTAVSATGVFKPSPSSDMWFPSREWPVEEGRSARDRRMNAKAAEVALEHYKIPQKPCVFEMVFELATKRSENEIRDRAAESLVERMPESLRRSKPFGCCDVGGADFCVQLESNFLTTANFRIMARLSPPSYPKLGILFDQLHPLMFGNKKLCRGIGRALGSDAHVLFGKGKTAVSAVFLNPKSDMKAAAKRASKWLLIN